MSFLDPSDDRPRRGSARRGGGAATAPDRQALNRRRAVAGVVGVALFVGLMLAVKGCLDARKERAFKDYVRDMAALMEESRQQSSGFFSLLRQPGRESPVDLQNSVNGFRVQADQLVERAREADRPDELAEAQGYLVEALEFRRDGLAGIAGELLTALGDQGRREATDRIARDMQAFLASDVLYERRVVPALRRPLADEALLGEVDIPSGRFLTDLEWLRPATVSERLARIRGGGEAAGPGPHGTGLGTVTVGGQALTAGATARVPAGPSPAVAVQVHNQGASIERDVAVEVSITGGGARPIEVRRIVEELPAGASKMVALPLPASPPTGRPVTVKVAVAPVPGERKVDNNRATFSAVFSR